MMDEDPTDPGVFWAHHLYFGRDASNDRQRQTWLGLIDVNRSLTNDLDDTTANPPQRGEELKLIVKGAKPGTTVKWYYSYDGCTEPTVIVPMSATLDIANAVYFAQKTADSEGTAEKTFTVPVDFPLGDIWIQAAEYGNTSEVIATEIVDP